jgi:hypothetical protein
VTPAISRAIREACLRYAASATTRLRQSSSQELASAKSLSTESNRPKL